jgi:hypothetical protein
MNLQITSEDGTQDVGKISKQWSGLMREYEGRGRERLLGGFTNTNVNSTYHH